MSTLWQDLRYAARMLSKLPGFTSIAVLTLALGIGANTAIFSVIDATLLRPLPFKEPQRLLAVSSTDLRNPLSKLPVSLLDLSDYQSRSRSFESFGAWFTIDMTLTGGSEPARVKGKGTAGDLFGVLGEAPLYGRVLRAGDHYAAVLSYDLWRSRFQADPNAVGQSITLNGESYTVVGVMPRGFRFPIEAETGDLWMTWDYARMPGPARARDARLMEAIARLRPGATIEQAQAELDVIAGALRQEHPETNKEIGARVESAVESLVGRNRRGLLILLGAVGCVLLVACVNVANLLLARTAERRRELAVRAALGASRSRMMRQLLSESLLLAFAGGLLGSLIALWGVDALVALNPDYLPGADRIGINAQVFAFTLVASLLTGVLFGLAPAVQASGIELTAALKDGARSATQGTGSRRLRSGLVVAEISLSFILLVGAGLLLGSFYRLQQVDPGFDPRNILTFRLSLPYEKYSAAQAGEFFRRLQEQLQAIPGVRAVANVMPLPLNGDPDFQNIDVNLDTRLAVEGRMLARHELPRIDATTVQPGYFGALGVKIISGRDFSERDNAQSAPAAIINETLARRYFPGEDPIGKRVGLHSIFTRGEPVLREIVGVVGDVRQRGLREEARPELYVPFAQDPFQEMFVVVKTDSDPAALVSAVRTAVSSIDKEQPIFNVRTLEDRLHLSLSEQRFQTVLLGVFAGLALLLSGIGLYGVLACSVAERRREIGIRLALGAQGGDVVRMVVRQALSLAFAGLALGIAGAIALARLMTGLLYGVSPTDPLTYALIAALFALIALLACYIPARQATRVDPMIALRAE